MAQNWEHLKAGGILDDPRRTEEFILGLLGEVESLKKHRDTCQEEIYKLRSVMKMKEAAALQRLEAAKGNLNAQLLEMQSDKMLQSLNMQQLTEVQQEYGYGGFIRPVQPFNDREEDLYSVIPTAVAKVATDDINIAMESVASLEEQIEVELHDEPARADSSVPRLPPRPRSISQSTVFRIATIQETSKKNQQRSGSFTRILRSLHRKKTA